MTHDNTITSREMSFFESTHQEATIHLLSSPICCWASATGPVTTDHLRSAMKTLHDRHPLLRARVDGETGQYRFMLDVSIDDIPLQEVELAEGQDFDSAIELFMSGPFTGWDRTWGVCFVQAADRSRWWVIIQTHHSITDGRSAFCLLDQLGEILGLLVAGKDVDTAPLELPTAIEHQVDPPGTMDHWKKTAQAWADRIGEISYWPVDETADFKDRRSCNTFTVHDEDFTRRLTEACHANRTTVQGALASAVTRGIAAYLGHAVNIDTLTPVDLRRYATVEIDPREVACKITCLDTGSFNISSDSEPWQVARDYLTTLNEQLDAAFYPPLDFTAEDVTGGLQAWADVDGRHTHGFCLTNTGLLHFDGDHGDVQFETMDVTASCRFGGFPVLLSAYTYRGCLRCTYSWPMPLVSREHGEALSEAVESHLREMVDGDRSVTS
ncbi:MAG: condensation domain-containing protein [Phycisphaerales bacterium]|nr:condensation domain-containing protein [Phycisphaerales bacterium]